MITEADLLAALPWALPPFLGACIGYLTNALAIRMLFRPLQRWKILGIPIPLTPGIIPRRRGELAGNIGRMVAQELLTAEVFATRFDDSRFARSVQRFIVIGIDRLGDTPLQVLRDTLPVDTLITDTDSYAPQFIGMLAEPVARIPVLQSVSRDHVDHLVRHVWPEARSTLEDLLRSSAVQAEMHVRARRILHYSLDQLTSLQRLFVSAAQYDRQLESRIPSIVQRSTAEILSAVDSTSTREGIIDGIYRWISANRERTLGELIGDTGVEGMFTAVQRALSRGGVEAHSMLAEGAFQWLDQHRNYPLGDLLPMIRRRRAVLARWIARRIQTTLRRVIPRVLEQIDIHGIVVDRIESLDIERVEGLLLGIMQRHLKWINVFGAVLGGLIGGVQILLRLVGLT
ncbi:MAG: DUF445 family protein [Alkalispirochaeta sp.]